MIDQSMKYNYANQTKNNHRKREVNRHRNIIKRYKPCETEINFLPVVRISPPTSKKKVEQKGMTFDHDFSIHSPFILPSFFKREDKRGKE